MTGSTVLIVDDDSSLRRALALNVEVAGYRVVEAADGLEGIQQLQSDPTIGVIICDIIMPKMNGADFLEKARAIRPDVPCIMITGYSANDLMHKALRHGAYTVLSKPFDPRALLAIVGRAITAPVVLIVDSEAEAIAEMLQTSHIRTRVVASPAAAIEALQANNIDVAVVDSSKTDMSSLEAMTRAHRGIRLVVLVPPDQPPMLRLTGGATAFTFMQKPVQADKLLQVIATARGASLST